MYAEVNRIVKRVEKQLTQQKNSKWEDVYDGNSPTTDTSITETRSQDDCTNVKKTHKLILCYVRPDSHEMKEQRPLPVPLQDFNQVIELLPLTQAVENKW